MRWAVLLLLVASAFPQVKPCHGKRCRSVTVRWQASETPSVTAYGIYRNGRLIFKGVGYSFRDTVQAGQIYTYYGTTFLYASESAPSNSVSIAIP